jgi:hypothetical protein
VAPVADLFGCDRREPLHERLKAWISSQRVPERVQKLLRAEIATATSTRPFHAQASGRLQPTIAASKHEFRRTPSRKRVRPLQDRRRGPAIRRVGRHSLLGFTTLVRLRCRPARPPYRLFLLHAANTKGCPGGYALPPSSAGFLPKPGDRPSLQQRNLLLITTPVRRCSYQSLHRQSANVKIVCRPIRRLWSVPCNCFVR